MSPRNTRLADQLGELMETALNGDEDDIRERLERLDQSALSRLRNLLRTVADLAEDRRKILWRQR